MLSESVWFFIIKDVGAHIPNQKFDSIRISVLRDTTNIWKKIDLIKDVKNIYFT